MASENADHMLRQVGAEDIAQAYQHPLNWDPYKDLLIAEVDSEMVGYTRGWWQDEDNSARLYKHNGFLVPERRRMGVGQGMLAWMEKHLYEISLTHPPELAKYYQVNVTQYQIGAARLLERNGYQPQRYFIEMVRPNLDDILELPLPGGLEIRPVTQDQYRLVWLSADEASRDEWGYKPPSEADYQEWLTSPLFQPGLWQVAWDVASGQVAGHVLTYIHQDENKQFNRKRGYTEGIGVGRAWRHRGLARALISRSLLAQRSAGMTESALVVDSDNPSGATRLYESCGFQVVKQDTIYRKPLPRMM